MKNILKILTFLFILTSQIGYTQIKNCDGPFDVDLSAYNTHTFDEVLLQLGIATIQDFNSLKPKFDMVIGGTLLLDKPNQEILFDGTRIKMLENASIEVRNNTTLSLQNSTYIFGCDKPWKRILVISSTINVNSCRIEDAEIGIQTSEKAKVNLYSVNFINNTSGLRLGTTDPPEIQLSLSQCTFKTDNNYMGKKELPICGIFLTHIPYIDLSPNLGERNTFENLQCGIFALSTSIRIIDTDFRNIHNSNSGLFNYAINIFNTSHNSIGGSVINHNYFYNVENAIKYRKSDIYAYNNEIIICQNLGISVDNAESFIIEENFIGSLNVGININSCHKKLEYSAFKISNNNIIIEEKGNAKGIAVNIADGIDISENVINMWEGEAGIYVNESDNVTIFHNNIKARGGYGSLIDCIQLISSNNSSVSYNNLEQPDFTICCVPSSRGIYSESAYGFIGCNNTDNFTKAGIAFMDDCDNTRLDGNRMYNYKDLVLGGEEVITFIGKQGDFINKKGWGNLWTGDMGGSAYNYSPPNYVKYSQFLVNAYLNPDYKPMTIVAESNDWFINKPDVINESSCTQLPYGGHHKVGPEDFDCNDFINKIIQIDTSRALDACKKDIWKYHYFKKLLVMKKLNLLTGECLSFFNRYNDNILVKIAKVDSAITNILINQTTDSLLYENIVNTQADLNELHDQGLVFSPQYQQTMTLYNQLLEDHSKLMEVERAEDTRKADSVKNVISTINVSDTCLSLLLRTFDIELDFIKSDTLTAAQLTQVRDISELCPYLYGDAVYLSRALRSIYENVRYESIEECAPERLNPRSNENNSITKEMYLYPNPATDELNISLNDADVSSGNGQISDITGKAISEFRIDQPKSEYRINTSSFKSGLYFVKYTSDSGHEIIEKFVILK